MDLCRRDDITKQSNYPHLVLAAGEGVFNYEALCEGKTKLEITISEASGIQKVYEIQINYALNRPFVDVVSISEII